VNSAHELRTPVGDDCVIKTVMLPNVFIEQFSYLLRSGSLVSSFVRDIITFLREPIDDHKNGIYVLAKWQSRHEVYYDIEPRAIWD